VLHNCAPWSSVLLTRAFLVVPLAQSRKGNRTRLLSGFWCDQQDRLAYARCTMTAFSEQCVLPLHSGLPPWTAASTDYPAYCEDVESVSVHSLFVAHACMVSE
jgi:hypothetical protein